MDKPAKDWKDKEAQSPQYQQNDRNCDKHVKLPEIVLTSLWSNFKASRMPDIIWS